MHACIPGLKVNGAVTTSGNVITLQCIPQSVHTHKHIIEKIKANKCLDTCQNKTRFGLTLNKYDLTLYAAVLYSDACKIKLEAVQVNTKSAQKNVTLQLLYLVQHLIVSLE